MKSMRMRLINIYVVKLSDRRIDPERIMSKVAKL